jgi:Tol biopolymer transport system component/DNA-binding winged helix-turn-helix (wHTH) protein
MLDHQSSVQAPPLLLLFSIRSTDKLFVSNGLDTSINSRGEHCGRNATVDAELATMETALVKSKLAFGLYEVDLQTGELWKAGFRIKLQSQPFKVLTALLERPGQIVTREELQLKLWGRDTTVDFDHSLGTAINKIREALGDSAENPRFIETLSRRGYRFIAPVSRSTASSFDADELEIIRRDEALSDARLVVPNEEGARPDSVLPTAMVAGSPVRWRKFWYISIALAVVALFTAVFLLHRGQKTTDPPHISKITQNGHLATNLSNVENLAAGVTDGVHLFAPIIDNGQTVLAAISLNGGAVARLSLPPEVASPVLGDISPDGSRLLLKDHLSPESEQPLWVVPTLGGSAQRVGNVLAHEATWMPDGNGILFANGDDLYVTHLTGNTPKLYARLPGLAFWMRWEPAGKLLRFTIIDPLTHTLSLWQLKDGGGSPVPILAGFTTPSNECCGVWNADGSLYIFQSTQGGNSDLWKLQGESLRDPVRLTDGPLQFQSPVASKTGNRLYFLGVDVRSDLQRLTPTGLLVPEKSFLSSAIRVDYTRDGKWVAWTGDKGELWRARTDGTEQLQISPEGLNVFLARWSPDGTKLALMARDVGKAWQIYVVGADGTELRSVLQETRNAADPSWSPDGEKLVFGRINDAMGKESEIRTLQILDLRTAKVETVPGSDKLFSPRWSPDGQYIAALSLDQRKVKVFDVGRRVWTTLPVPSGADPIWSSDSRYLYLHASLDPAHPIDRISIPDGRVVELVRLADSGDKGAVDYDFAGLTPENMPLIRTRIFTGNVYSMSLR